VLWVIAQVAHSTGARRPPADVGVGVGKLDRAGAGVGADRVVHRQGDVESSPARARAGIGSRAGSKSEQLAALTTLAAGAAHELNTPLGTIAVVAKELELNCDESGGCTEGVLDDARLIRREVDRCRSILSRMRVDIGEEVSHRTEMRIDELVARLRDSLHDAEQSRLVVRRHPSLKLSVARRALWSRACWCCCETRLMHPSLTER